MINYIKGECYRLAHKKGNYIYLAVISVLFVGLVMLYSASETISMGSYIELGAILLLSFIPLVIGIHVFLAVYNDDLSSKSLSNVLASGVPKAVLVVAKIIVAAIYELVVFIVIGLIYLLMYVILINDFSADALTALELLVKLGGMDFFLILGYCSIASLVTYFVQKPALNITFFIILVSQFLNQILELIGSYLTFFKPLTDNTLTALVTQGLTQIMKNKFPAIALLGCGLYIIGGVVLASLIIRSREIQID